MKEKTIIETVFTKPKKATIPTLLQFQNGELAAVSKDNVQYCRFKLIEDDVKAKGSMVVTNDQVYHGLSNAEESEQLTDTYVCVRNKTTNKMRILPIERVRLNNHVYKELEKKPFKGLSEEVANNTLLQKFGGRGAKRYILNKEKMKVNIDIVKDALDTTVNESSVNVEPDQSVDFTKHLDSLSPKFNADATKLSDVYDVNDVLSTDLLERMEEEARVVFSSNINELPIASEYLLNCIKNIQNSTASPSNFLNIKLIIYMDALLNLMKTRTRLMHSIELSGITEKVENEIRQRFADPNSTKLMRTLYSNEKALCHFIVLALLISENYEIDVNILTKELNTTRAKVIKFAKLVHARLKAKSDILALRLPSKTPPMTVKSSKSSKKFLKL